MTARRPLRLLHTSDVHLGGYDHGHAGSPEQIRRRAHSEAMFRAVIDVGLREQVDILIIAGDFFDNARVHEDTLRFAAAEIARLEKPTVIFPGNHDHVGAGSVYDRIDLMALAQNLHIARSVEGELLAFGDLDLELWGKAHLEHDTYFAPFAGAPPRGDAAWQVAVGHGHYLHPRSGHHPSFHIREADLAALEHDYIALGHWEQQTRVAAGERLAAYSGAPDGLASFMGASGRVLVVDLEGDGAARLTSHALEEGPPMPHDEIPFLQGGEPTTW